MRLLIIDDDTELSAAVASRLVKEGFCVDACADGGDAGFYLGSQAYNAVILDRLLPGKDGLSILKDMRARGDVTPVLMLTALDAVADRTDGLDAGADDYLVKPFAMAELVSRVRALLRRPAAMAQPDALCACGMELNAAQCKISYNGAELTLSKREAAVLEVFFENPGKVLSRAQILARVWGGDDAVEEGNVDNYIYFVRRRLKALGAPAAIKAAHGVGFSLVGGDE